MNDWMDTHQFQEGVTLGGEERLWYESIRPIIVGWQGLQNQFRQQYSKTVTQKNSYFMHGNHFILMRIQKH